MKRLFMLILMTMLLAGCAATEKTIRPDPPAGEPDFSAPVPGQNHEQTPLDFGEALALDEAIDVALQHNPGIKTQEYRTDSARAGWREARGKRLPHLNAQATADRYLDDQRLVGARSPGEPGTWSENLFGADLVLELPLFTGGQLVNRASAARLLSEASLNRLGRTREEVVFNVSSTFYAILEQRQVIDSLRFSRKAVARQKEKIQDMIAVQKGVKVDLLRVRVRLADIEQQIITEENRLDALYRLLANQLGLETEQKRLPVKGELRFEAARLPAEVSWQTLYERRQDYQALQNEVAAAEKALAAARGEYWPQLNLRGTYGGRWAAGDPVEQPGASDSEDVGSIGLQMELPLFTGGEISARTNRARAEQNALQERLRELKLQIRMEVQNARDAIKADINQVQTTKAAIAEAKEALDIEQLKYDLGKGTIVDVLDAQDALLRAQTNLARALAAYNTDLARLELAQGKVEVGEFE
jgi:outer membrane protein TolC